MPGPRCWIGVAARDHVRRGMADGFVMFAHGQHAAVKRVSPGDRFAYYAPMTGLGIGEPVRAFVAIGEVLSGEPHQAEMAPQIMGWQRPARYFEAQQADIYPLLERLSFVRDRQHWGMYFRKSLFEISPEDFSLIAQAMGAPTLP